MGAEGGTVISDRKFAGADVLATAYTISQGIKKMGQFDIIICGKQTTDGDTAQVGAEVSEFLGIPNVANVLSVEDIRDGKVILNASLDEKNVKMSVKLPCLISADGGLAGSATQVERIFPPEKNNDKCAITGDAQQQTDSLFELICDKKLI